jgi:hypothetical protein
MKFALNASLRRGLNQSARESSDMRILHLTESLGRAGKEQQLVELLRGLFPHRNVESFVALTDEVDGFRYELDREHAQVIQLFRRGKRDLRLFKSLYELVSNLKIDIVHSWSSICSVYAAPVAKLYGTAFVNGFVRDAPSHMTLWNKNYLMGKLTIPFSDIVVANSRAQRSMDLQWVQSCKGP